MPMERDRYPADWEKLALKIKRDTEWHCEHCGKPCRRPGESLEEFAERLPEAWRSQLMGEVWDDESGEHAEVPLYPGRFVLTTSHSDQDPSNNAPSNLRALCSPCHLRYDGPRKAANAMAKRERRGQIPLPLTNHPSHETYD
jgi:hypothetical protein